MGTITIIVQSSHVIQICVTYPQGAKELTFTLSIEHLRNNRNLITCRNV